MQVMVACLILFPAFDLSLTFLNHRLGDAHAPSAANRSCAQGVERDPDHEGEGDDGQAIARNQPVEEVQDWNQQVVGDVSDHVEETGGILYCRK